MKKLLLITAISAFSLLISNSAKAQYKNALGVRLGDSYGVTFKTFLQSDKALDFILNLKDNNSFSLFRLSGLYEIHQPITELEGLNWYYGGGGTLGSYNYKNSDDSDILLSVDGVIGLDYKFDEVPINVSLDWKPAIELTPNTTFDARGVGLSVRITF